MGSHEMRRLLEYLCRIMYRNLYRINREDVLHGARNFDARIYFAHPYASWERGLNENTNGLIWQYFPNGRDLATVRKHEIEQAMDKLNHHPRKSLGYRIPYEVFFNIGTSLTVALQS